MNNREILNQLLTGNHLEPNELDRAFEILHQLNKHWEQRRRIIKVKFHSEDTGFCRKYYKGIDNGRMYAHQEEAPDLFIWYTVTSDGEPIAPIRKSIKMEVVEE